MNALFKSWDVNRSGTLSFEELEEILITGPPATAPPVVPTGAAPDGHAPPAEAFAPAPAPAVEADEEEEDDDDDEEGGGGGDARRPSDAAADAEMSALQPAAADAIAAAQEALNRIHMCHAPAPRFSTICFT